MKTAIIYISKHGTTFKIASKISEKLSGEVHLINLEKTKMKTLDEFDRIIIGGSIHMGKIHKRTAAFINKFYNDLMLKELGLFLCCMETGDKAKEQFNNAFPTELRNHAKSTGLMGFEYLLEKMGFIEKMMVKKITGKDQSFSKIDETAITEFAANFS